MDGKNYRNDSTESLVEGGHHAGWTCPPAADLQGEVVGGPALARIYQMSGRLQQLAYAETTAVGGPGTSADCDGLDEIESRIRSGAVVLVDLILLALGRKVSLGHFLGMTRPDGVAQGVAWSEFLDSLGLSSRQAHAAIRFSRHLDALEESGCHGDFATTITFRVAGQDPSQPGEAGPDGTPAGLPGVVDGNRLNRLGGRLLDALDEAIGALESDAGLARLGPLLNIALEWLAAQRRPSDESGD